MTAAHWVEKSTSAGILSNVFAADSVRLKIKFSLTLLTVAEALTFAIEIHAISDKDTITTTINMIFAVMEWINDTFSFASMTITLLLIFW